MKDVEREGSGGEKSGLSLEWIRQEAARRNLSVGKVAKEYIKTTIFEIQLKVIYNVLWKLLSNAHPLASETYSKVLYSLE